MSAGVPIAVCEACGHAVYPPHLACARCGGQRWREEIETDGIVDQVTVVRRRVGGPAGEPPIPVASVRTGLGPVVIARAEAELEPGDRVALALDGRVLVARRA